MDDKIIDGKKIALKQEERLKEKLKSLGKKPKVVSVLIGDDPASLLYTQMKQKKAQDLGIDFQFIHFPETVNFSEVGLTIVKLNQDPQVNGVMIQLPLPENFLQDKKAEELLNLINPKKDVDGLTENSRFLPAAVKAVMTILEEEGVNIKGKFVVVLGTSRLIGMPIAREVKKQGALVSSCNKGTPNINDITKRADILISATGAAGLVTGDMVKDGVIVIDVGTLVIEDELKEPSIKVLGDVDFGTVVKKASKITPVPGGVGPVTVVSLMENVTEAATLD